LVVARRTLPKIEAHGDGGAGETGNFEAGGHTVGILVSLTIDHLPAICSRMQP
jgi:hypothetical protein